MLLYVASWIEIFSSKSRYQKICTKRQQQKTKGSQHCLHKPLDLCLEILIYFDITMPI